MNKRYYLILGLIICSIFLISNISKSMWSYKSLEENTKYDNINEENEMELVMFIEGDKIDSFSEVPSGYIVDPARSYCMNDGEIDTDAVVYINEDGKLSFSNLSKGVRCYLHFRIPGPSKYWFPTTLSTWNEYTWIYTPNYLFPTTSGTVQTTGSATGHRVYMGQDRDMYYLCANILSHEVCFSQPYTQYGIESHILEHVFTSADQNSIIQAIRSLYTAAGISINDISCSGNSNGAYCTLDTISCGIGRYGNVSCYDQTEEVGCNIDHESRAACSVE